ncbi:hypothetical protein [uncultured Sphingomonas sp.]|uniref:hypothetical protein n=1 Tax=uncultured Sphingomonas sp. TaxID=158754 RepID=UPI0025D026AD|nr:hypothetical protein [uncultured Sphingomonas sp.]
MKHVMALVLVAAQPAAAGQIGVDAAATQTAKGAPATFDLAGFRLGMTEGDVERVMRERGLIMKRRTRTDTFEDRVRKAVNLRGGRLPLKGGSVLDSVEFDDGKGGKVMIGTFVWPDGARVRSVAYLPPAGTDPAAWRTMLVGKYGPLSRDSGGIDGEGLHARWCARAACLGQGGVFRLAADVGLQGGQITLSQPEGTGEKAMTLIEREASRRGTGGTPSL